MKHWFFVISIFIYHFAIASPLQDRRIDSSALTTLSTHLGIPANSDLIAETQKRWLRSSTQERWEMQELSLEEKQIVLQWAKEQGFFSPWQPSSKEYDLALILGATTSHMQQRLNYLKQLWEKGVRVKNVVWLTGDRPLDPQIDGLTDRCTNESEAAHILWEEAVLPEELRHLPVTFIAVPMKQEGKILKRPNTQDTIVAWLDTQPSPCSALFISTQPFCGYQHAVVAASLPDAFLFDVVGPGADPASHPAAAAITLDALARWLYQIEQNQQVLAPPSKAPRK